MSIASELNRIRGNVAKTYTALEQMGATLPETQNTDGLEAAVQSIPTGSSDAVLYTEQTLTEEQKTQARKNIGAEKTLTFDTAPTADSTNPVTSGGVYTDVNNLTNRVGDNEAQRYVMTALSVAGALTWNGVPSDDDIVVEDEEYNLILHHVTEEVPQRAALDTLAAQGEATCFIGESGVVYSLTTKGIDSEMFEVAENVFIAEAVSTAVFVVFADHAAYGDMFVFPKRGVYFAGIWQLSISELTNCCAIFASSFCTPCHQFNSDSGASKYFETQTATQEYKDTLVLDELDLPETNRVHTGDATSWARGPVAWNVTLEELKTMTMTATLAGDDAVYTVVPDEKTATEQGFLLSIEGILNCAAVTKRDGVEISGVILPERGLYFFAAETDDFSLGVATFTAVGQTFTAHSSAEIIKQEHLPVALRFGDVVEDTTSDTITWDFDGEGMTATVITEFVPSSSDAVTAYRLSDATPTEEELKTGTITFRDLSTGQEDTGPLSADVSTNATGAIIVAEGFVVIPPSVATATVPAGLYVADAPALAGTITCSLTVPGCVLTGEKTTKIVPIDEKYLPAGVLGSEVRPKVVDVGDTLVIESVYGLPTDSTGGYLKVSDYAPSLDEIKNGGTLRVKAPDGTQYEWDLFLNPELECTDDEWALCTELSETARLNAVVSLNGLLYVHKEPMAAGNATITVPGAHFRVIKEVNVTSQDSLPDALCFGDVNKDGGDTLICGDVTDDMTHSGDYYLVSALTPSAEEMKNGVVLYGKDNDGLVVASTYRNLVETDDSVRVLSDDGNVVALIVQYKANSAYSKPGIWVLAKDSTADSVGIMIDGYTGFPGTHIESIPMSEKYLPESAATKTYVDAAIKESLVVPSLTIGTVDTLDPGSSATASITGTAEEPVLNLGIPKGESGSSEQVKYVKPATVPMKSGQQLIIYGAEGGDVTIKLGTASYTYHLDNNTSVFWGLWMKTGDIDGSFILPAGTRRYMYAEIELGDVQTFELSYSSSKSVVVIVI